jgi:O-methyltransferase involved in polyketide biosynthesis
MVSNSKSKVSLTGAPSTTLITLYGRHLDATSPSPILNDIFSSQVLTRLDFDFSSLTAGNGTKVVTATRGRHLDRWIVDFLARHGHGDTQVRKEEVTIVQLGCGLDTRSHRVEWAEGVRWIDVDLDGVIELRGQVLPPMPKGEGGEGRERDYTMISGSATSREVLERLPNDRVTLIIMEGLTSYLPPEEGEEMIKMLCDHFKGEGGEMITDITGRLTGWVSRGFSFVWRMKSRVDWVRWCVEPREFEGLHPGLSLVEADSWTEMDTKGRFGWGMRALLWALRRVEVGRNSWVWCRFTMGGGE